MSVSDPTFTRHDDGSITAQWPDPPRPFYQVAHEVLVEYVDRLNELNNLRREKDAHQAYIPGELMELEGGAFGRGLLWALLAVTTSTLILQVIALVS